MFFRRTITGQEYSHPAFILPYMLNIRELDMWCHDDYMATPAHTLFMPLYTTCQPFQHMFVKTYLALTTHPGLLHTYYILL